MILRSLNLDQGKMRNTDQDNQIFKDSYELLVNQANNWPNMNGGIVRVIGASLNVSKKSKVKSGDLSRVNTQSDSNSYLRFSEEQPRNTRSGTVSN